MSMDKKLNEPIIPETKLGTTPKNSAMGSKIEDPEGVETPKEPKSASNKGLSEEKNKEGLEDKPVVEKVEASSELGPGMKKEPFTKYEPFEIRCIEDVYISMGDVFEKDFQKDEVVSVNPIIGKALLTNYKKYFERVE